MKTKISFSKKPHTSFLLAMVTLLLLSAQSTTLAGSASWNDTGNDWNITTDWMPNTVPNGSGDTATFNFAVNFITPFVTADTEVAGIVFSNLATNSFTITVEPTKTLTISGTGITNSSGKTQNFVTEVSGVVGEGAIRFTNSATAGSMTGFTNLGGKVDGSPGGRTTFFNTSSADHGAFTNNGGTVITLLGADGGFTVFNDSATADHGTFTNNAGTVGGANGGHTEFNFTSTAGSGTFTNNGAAVSSGFGGTTAFFDTSTADNGTFTNNGGTANGAEGGRTEFNGVDATHFSTAGSGTFTNNGGTVSGANGGTTAFFGTSTGGNGTFTNNGSAFSGLADDANGGRTIFDNSSTAGSATLMANGGPGTGGAILFGEDSTGGTSTVKVFGNGNLDISAHNAGSVTIGSLEGTGNVFLGANNLTVGSNNTSPSTPFSGVIQDGGISGGSPGSLTKTGTGTLTLTGANTYTGGTTVNDGHLFINNTTGSGTGTGMVTVNNGIVVGGTVLGGNGTISGAVTVNSGANLAPGPTGNGSTGILNTGSLTLASGSNFSLDLNGNVAGTSYDQVSVNGTVTLGATSNLVLNSVSGLTVGDTLFIVENNGIAAVTGTFSGLAEDAMFTSNGVTFQIDYDAIGVAQPNDIELSVIRVVPEPSTWLGGALAFAALAYTQRRRFAQMLRRT